MSAIDFLCARKNIYYPDAARRATIIGGCFTAERLSVNKRGSFTPLMLPITVNKSCILDEVRLRRVSVAVSLFSKIY